MVRFRSMVSDEAGEARDVGENYSTGTSCSRIPRLDAARMFPTIPKLSRGYACKYPIRSSLSAIIQLPNYP